MGELVVAGKGELEGDTEGLDRHDGDRADGRADGEVDEGVRFAVDGGHLVDHDGGKDNDDDGVEQEARLDGVVEDLVNRLNLLVRRGVEDNDDGADEADGAAELAQGAELLLEEVGAEDGADQNGEGTEGSDKDGGGECVGGKVADLTDAHCDMSADDATAQRVRPGVRPDVAVGRDVMATYK